MPTKYLLPTTNSQTSKDFSLGKILANIFLELETLEESKYEAIETIGKR
jgi:hypothetical protein